jgi:hypothetical protein
LLLRKMWNPWITGIETDGREDVGHPFPPEIGLRLFASFGKGDSIGRMKRKKYFLPCQTRRKLIVDVVLQPKRTLLPPDSVIWQTENDKCHCNFFLNPPPLFAIRVIRPCVMRRKCFTSYVPLLVFFLQNGMLLHGFLNVSIAYQP